MADGVSMKIRRKDALFYKLRKLRPSVDKELAKAINKGAKDFVDMARTLAPVDDGDLRLSFEEKPMRGKMGITVSVGGEQAYYARWVEFGTAPHIQGGQFKGTFHPGTRAQPFFFPAYRIQKPRIQRRLTRAINLAAKQVAKAR